MSDSIKALAASLPDTQNLSWRSDKNSFGQKLLAKMGWKEGKGLGKREDGIVDHVKVKRRIDSAGIGIASSVPDGVMGGRNGNEVLLSAVSDFNAMLSKMTAKRASDSVIDDQLALKKNTKNGNDKEVEDEGELQAVEVDEEEQRRRRKMEKKLKRKRLEAEAAEIEVAEAIEAQIVPNVKSSFVTMINKNESSLESETLSNKVIKTTTSHVPAGRHKVLRQKNTSRYSAADMAAILGQLPSR